MPDLILKTTILPSLMNSKLYVIMIIHISEHEVRLLFKELNSRKSPGPDNISPLLLKSCHNELSGVYQHLFQLSITSGIPRI